MSRQRITPFFWFDDQAEQAAKFYVSIFGKRSRITRTARYNSASAKAAGRRPGSVMTVAFELDGHEYVALNGGPLFTFNESISFVVNCGSQEEMDWYWTKLSEGGQPLRCGWLKDRFGVSWQIVPTLLGKWMSGRDQAKAQRVMRAVLQMGKLDIADLKIAASGRISSRAIAKAPRK